MLSHAKAKLSLLPPCNAGATRWPSRPIARNTAVRKDQNVFFIRSARLRRGASVECVSARNTRRLRLSFDGISGRRADKL